MNKKNIIIFVLIAIVLILVVVMLVNNGSAPKSQQLPPQAVLNNQAPTQAPVAPSNQAQPTQTPQPTQPPAAPTQAPSSAYASSADGFSVKFPGIPQVSKIAYKSLSAGSIPLTKYIVESGSGASAKYYMIYVYHYPKDYKFSATYLADSLRLFAAAMAVKYPGTKLVSQAPSEFQGGSAISGVLSGPDQEPGQLLITVKNQNTYAIGAYGANQEAFKAFENSFAFTQ
jgi:hypothetical protein